MLTPKVLRTFYVQKIEMGILIKVKNKKDMQYRFKLGKQPPSFVTIKRLTTRDISTFEFLNLIL